jgi:uncharacterized membrane protein YphA (DoxX/SURF4 family)
MKMKMENLVTPGRVFFAIAIGFFGGQYLIYASGVGGPAPGPPWTPGRLLWAYVAGAALLVAGVSIATGKMARLAAILLGAGLFLRVMTIHLPRMIVNLYDPGPWTSAGEMLAMCGGAFVLAGTLSGSPFSSKLQGSIPDWMTKLGRCLYAFPLFIFGTQHLMYARFVSTLVPAWIPGRLFWAYFVGIAFFAAALSIIARKIAPLAASLLGLMFLLWVILLHLPRVAAAPRDGKEWTSAFVALAMSGIAFVLAGTFTRSK